VRRFTIPARTHGALVTVLALVLLAGCSGGDDDTTGDSLQIVENPQAAQPADSPDTDTSPDGERIDVDGDISALLADSDSGTLAAATTDPDEVVLYDLTDVTTDPSSRTEAPGEVTDFTFTADTLLASVPDADTVLRIPLQDPDAASTVDVTGEPAATAQLGSRTLFGLHGRDAVLVHDDDAANQTITGDLYSVDDVVVADGTAFVLDRLRTALFRVDVSEGEFGEGLRAGQGATNATVDAHGRVLVTDTRGGSLLVFGTDPLLLRQRYPVPGGVYGIAYDTERDVAWVTATERNEVVGFDMTGGQPEEEYRYSTVRQPNSVAADSRTGRVIVGSAAEEGMQVITP